MSQSFIHLRLHTEYSLVDGLLTLNPLFAKAKKYAMSALAITDYNNLFAAIKFYKAALSVGIKPIIGTDLAIYNEQNPKQPYVMTCLCQNQQGYQNLMQLISQAYLHASTLSGHKIPMILPKWLHSVQQGLIFFSGERQGDVGEALLKQNEALALTRLDEWLKLLGNRFYIEIQRNNRLNQDDYIQAAYHLAATKGVPLLATNDVRFLNHEDYEAHEARVCIHEGCILTEKNRPHHYSEQQYFKSQQEMLDLFSDLPEALTNTVELSKRCTLELNLGKVFFPKFIPPAGISVDEYCSQCANKGLQARFNEAEEKNLSVGGEPLDKKLYQQRLNHELAVIHTMGFSAYFLIVADFIAWARAHDIPVGPGRGSGAGSLVAYALRITDIDPIPYKLLFERFLNPERVSLPDFDIDFCMIGRDRVIEYVAEKYGRECVAQIITFGTMTAKAVVRDVGRVLAQPYGFVDKLAKLIPFSLGITLARALSEEELLRQRYEQEEEVHDLIDLARKLEGITRNAGKHAGGVVIAPSKLTNFTPLYCETTASTKCLSPDWVTQYDKDGVEAIGLIKFDFLGLRTLTILDWAIKAINKTLAEQKRTTLNISNLPLNDVLTFDLIKSGETLAVFQIESRGMKDLLRRLQPDCFEDIIALVALYRPGPLQSGMVDDFIDRKHGRAVVLYPHPALEEILKPTYGVILYQEQVMQIAQVLAGYTLGNADLLRRAMGKKKPEEMAKQREIFLKGAQKNQVSTAIANTIFDLMEKFAGYGFNKSHSAAYALISYQTAWLKTHYPAQFMAAVLSSDMDNTDKIVSFLYECRRMAIKLLPPDINTSEYYFTVPKVTEVSNVASIRYGLGAIKGVGNAAVQLIVEARQRNGFFKNLFDFCKKIEGGKLNRRTLESLIRSGALDSIHACRATLLRNLEFAINKTEQEQKCHHKGQQDLFAMLAAEDEFEYWTVAAYEIATPMTERERLQGEKDTLGFYLSGHPLDRYAKEFNALHLLALTDVQPINDKTVQTRGILVNRRQFFTKNGSKMAVVTIEDQQGKMDVTIFSDLYQEVAKKLEKDQIILVEGTASVDEFNQQVRLVARTLLTLEEMFTEYAHCLSLSINFNDLNKISLSNLLALLNEHRNGRTLLKIKILDDKPNNSVELIPAEQWRIRISVQLLHQLEHLLGAGKAEIAFSSSFLN